MKQALTFAILVMFFSVVAPRLHTQAVECSSPKSSAEETECARQELAVAKADLKQVLANALQLYPRTTGKDEAPLPKSDVREQRMHEADTRRALITSQRVFVQYRAAACECVAKMYEGGSITEMAVASCQAALTRDRSKFLRDYFGAK
jgi:uncharacterized protein YecT (DUF1311 family)